MITSDKNEYKKKPVAVTFNENMCSGTSLYK